MKHRFAVIGLALAALSAIGIYGVLVSSDTPAIIPLPAKMEARSGFFYLGGDTAIVADQVSLGTAELLAKRLQVSTGLPLPVRGGANQTDHAIVLGTNRAAQLGPEAYELTVTPSAIRITGGDAAGVFYGTQTLLQLLPPQALADKCSTDPDWKVPCVHIQDGPRFKWRGLLLDVSRHFFSKSELEHFVDVMALHKFNRLQLHLTDDQGWRIEIKKYPRLTSVGAWRKSIGFRLDPKSSSAYGPDGRYGGFYTQADIRELVAYAEARHVTIVPEIEMPGHAGAALSAYPQFSCSGQAPSPDVGAGVFRGVYCVGEEKTFGFIEDVLSEVIDLFPGKYIHVGGDEVPKTNWKECPKCQARMRTEGLNTEQELQSYFVRRIERFLQSKGRTLVGWSEIRQGGLAPNAVVMDWIGGGVEAAKEGHDVVMSPNTHCYFDFYQTENRKTEPHAIGGFLPLDKVYSYDPIPAGLPPSLKAHILGLQGNIWTEYIPSLSHLEYMTYPRACALAEVGWSLRGTRNWDDFVRRLETHLKRLDALGVNYRKGIPAQSTE